MPIDMTNIGGDWNRPPRPGPGGPGRGPGDVPVDETPVTTTDDTGGTDWWSDWNKPQWMQGSPYLKFGAEGAGQPWWRDPKGGYHTVWNPYWGWQDKLAVQKQYKTGEGGWTPTQEQFEGWGFTQQPGETPGGWENYFPGRLTKATDPNFQRGGEALAPVTDIVPGEWPQMADWLKGPGYDQPVTAPEFQYPEELGLASQVLGDFAWTGMPTDIPEEWTAGSEMVRGMAETGEPVSQEDWYERSKGIVEEDILASIQQAAESAGLEGRRWSQSLGREAQDISGKTMARFGLGALERELAAEEAAKGRKMGAFPLLYQLGMGGAGLEEAAKGRGMTAAGMLPALAQMRQTMPLTAAGAAMGAGGQMQQWQQQMLDPLYREWQRVQPEASPWWQLGMGTAGLPGQMVPQQYQPSGLQSGLGGLLSLLPFLGMIGG